MPFGSSPTSNRRLQVSNRDAALIGAAAAIFLVEILLTVHLLSSLTRWVDSRLEANAFRNPAALMAAPTQVMVGQAATPSGLAAELHDAFYAEGDSGSDVGTYKLGAERLEIYPGKGSFFRRADVWEGAAILRFQNGRIASITSGADRKPLESYWLEPRVITTLFDGGREKRRLVRYDELPKPLVSAILATEDRQFFSHYGVSPRRIGAAAIADLKAEGTVQGGSTLTMQLARNLFLTPRRTFTRKLEEVFIALLLERRYNKQQIFESYVNQIYLGQWGSVGLYGVGDAAKAYFNKDLGSLTLPEAALLAGLIRGPNLYSPYKNPQRAVERRNFVLRQMEQCGYLRRGDANLAMATPLRVTTPVIDPRPEGFFVDLVKQQLHRMFSDRELWSRGLRVYTTMDPVLQAAAAEAVHLGAAEIDRRVKPPWKPKMGMRARPTSERDQPQMAMIALDPHSGEVRALVGGRDYSFSQLNHIQARRQPGSVFKPFVYAAALNSGVDGSMPLITTATILRDRPTTFQASRYDHAYTPKDYKGGYHGDVTVREALTHSLNVPTVSLAQQIGFDKVRNLAISAGFNTQLGTTPSLALGAYVATPMEVAGAYTVFANNGQYVRPHLMVEIDDNSGDVVWRAPQETRPVLDPRVSYLMVNLMEGVINNGTGASVRSRGFSLPAAGKTGTSHDGWFAGFTSNLLTVAWVGYDDDRDLNLTGSESALPVWAEFMKRATQQPYYRNVQEFTPPQGIVSVPIQTEVTELQPVPPTDGSDQAEDVDGNGQPVEEGQPMQPVTVTKTTRTEVFISGTEPAQPAQEPMPMPTTDQDPGNPGSPDAAPPATDAPSSTLPKTRSSISDLLDKVLGAQVVHAAPEPSPLPQRNVGAMPTEGW